MSFIKNLLDKKLSQYYNLDFIPLDPISIPHRYTRKQDIEIAGLLASILAWGKRSIILGKASELMRYMDNAPYDFVTNHTSRDLEPFLDFKHRTINSIDVLHILRFLQNYYKTNPSLEDAFAMHICGDDANVERALIGFYRLVFGLENSPQRTAKHIPTPERRSSCKRLNMFLRWMVREDSVGVDFGLWKKIRPDQLICPCDVHVMNTARKYSLVSDSKANWKTALELTENLKSFCPTDPIKYDFALFGLGIEGELE